MASLLVYLAAVALAEAVGVWVHPLYGVMLACVLIALMLVHYGLTVAPYRRVLPVLMLAPLLRVLSLVLTVPALPHAFSYALIGLPMLVAAILAAHHLGLGPGRLGLGFRYPLLQLVIAGTGVPLSLAAFSILRPAPVVDVTYWPDLLALAAAVVIFGGFMEELIFRGLFQQVVGEVFGGAAAVILSSFLFAVLYLGSLSVGYILFVGLVGVYFGYCVHKTGSIWGVTLAHSVMNLGLIIFLPAAAKLVGWQ